ncbi:MAG: hypothetical protein IPM29_07210 [Planctomycetes bacterium]|nr:hypothetical protein [Planctomycetota bacterium]
MPTRQRQPKQPVRDELTLCCPLATSGGGQVEVLLGFFDTADTEHVRPSLTRERPRDGLARVA